MNHNQENLIKEFIAEIVKKCDDDKWCLYTAKTDKKSGKRRRLGTHSSKKKAYSQEYAIKANQ
jgi:hypothetical protein